MTLDLTAVEVLLCDADGNLFPSEEPAFEASATVTNRLLAEHAIDRRFAPDELRRLAMGRTFRATAAWLAAEHDVALDLAVLERYVEDERREVIEHLGHVLAPDPTVRDPLWRLAQRYRLAVVSSSALARLAACFEATALDDLFPAAVRVSAEDSLQVPTSKPDPAVYAFACERFGVSGARALAIEDAVAGVQSAVAAGLPVVGNLHFVAADERSERESALLAAGAGAVAASWDEIEAVLTSGRPLTSARAAERAVG